MSATTTRLACQSDIEGILALQDQNLYTRLSEAERTQGFVTTPFTPALIEEALAEGGVFVAVHDDTVLGYAFAASWAYFSRWPIIQFMASRLPQLDFAGNLLTTNNSFQYGPVCIDHRLLGSGLFPHLFDTMRASFALRYPFGVTFINQRNPRSLRAHVGKLGLAIVDTFEFNDQSYYGLAFDTAIPVVASPAAMPAETI